MGRHGEGIRKRKDGRWEGRVPIINKDGNKGYKYLYAYSYCKCQYKNVGFISYKRVGKLIIVQIDVH